MAKRNHKAEYAARQTRARSKGFTNYYDERVRGGDLKTPRPKGKTLRRRRGHAGFADLLRRIERGQIEQLATLDGEKDRHGRWKRIRVRVTDIDGGEDMHTITRAVTPEKLRQLRTAIDASSTSYLSTPSLDIFVAFAETDEGGEEEIA